MTELKEHGMGVAGIMVLYCTPEEYGYLCGNQVRTRAHGEEGVLPSQLSELIQADGGLKSEGVLTIQWGPKESCLENFPGTVRVTPRKSADHNQLPIGHSHSHSHAGKETR